MVEPPKTFFTTDKSVVEAGAGQSKLAKKKKSRSIDRRLGVNPPDLSAQRGRPAPAFGANRDESKLSGVRLFERYGLVFNPEADKDPITQSERDALMELYSDLTGRDVTSEPDLRGALEGVGLVRGVPGPRVERRKRAKDLLRDGDVPEFVSAADALDWYRKNIKAPKVEKPKEERSGLADAATYSPALGPGTTLSYLLLANADKLKPVVDAVGEVAGPVLEPARKAIADIPEPWLGTSGIENRRFGDNLKETGKELASGLDAAVRAGQWIGENASAPGLYFTGAPAGQQPGVAQRRFPTTSRPAPRDRLKGTKVTLGEVVGASQDFADNPNKVVNVATDLDTNLEWADPRLNAAALAAQQGKRTEAVEGELRRQGPDVQNAQSPFGAREDQAYRAFAKNNGWPDEEWDSLPVAEKIIRANTKNKFLGIMFRNIVRSVGEQGAYPAAIKGMAEATASALRGDPAEAEAMIVDALSPFGRFEATRKKRGVWAALAEFARDDPAYFVYLMAGGAKAADSLAGRVSRGVGSEVAVPGRVVMAKGPEVVVPPVPKPEPPLVPRPGENAVLGYSRVLEERRRVAEENARRREAWDYADTEEAHAAAGDKVSVPIAVGVTKGRLINDVLLQKLKVRLVEQMPRYQKYLLQKNTRRDTRRQLNMVQGVGITITSLLENAVATRTGKRLRRPVDLWTKNRVAFNLVWADELLDGTPVTPGLVADMFEAQARELRDASKGQKFSQTNVDQLKYWDAQEKFFRRLDEVEVDPEVMARVREAARDLGKQNDYLIAATLGITPKEARRANYIRLWVLDPKFELAAQARKRAVNLEPAQLQLAQRKISRLSGQLLEYATPEGYGKKGATASRRRFGEVREQLIGEIVAARRLAESLEDSELVLVLDDALAKMRLARTEAAARATNLRQTFDALDELSLSREQVSGLAPEARAAYEAARAAEADVVRLRGEQEAALAELGAKRTTGASVEAAQKRVDAAQAELESALSFAKPDKQAVAKASKKLDEARARLDRVVAAQATKEPLRAAELSRDQKVREAKQIINAGRTVLDEGEVSAAISAAGDLAAVRVRTRKDFAYYTIERARNETLDAFIARVEAQDKNPLLHLVQKRSFQQLGQAVMVRGGGRVDASLSARVRPGRYQSSEGAAFYRGYEDPNLWKNLMFDTQELASSAAYSNALTNLLNATSLRWKFTDDVLAEASRLVEDGIEADEKLGLSPMSVALSQIIRDTSVVLDMQDVVVVPPLAPKARRPSERFDVGALEMMDPDSFGALTRRELTERDIDPDAPGEYYLVPRGVYNGILRAVRDESFRFTPPSRGGWRVPYWADRITRAWRTVTLNVFPRTAVVNSAGSLLLAVQAGAGPRAIQYAAMALYGIDMKMPDGSTRKLPVPPELRQRYYEQLTDPLSASKLRIGELPEPTPKDAAFAWMAWYMNSIRHVNGMSEDLGRLAVWYSNAYPAAMKASDSGRFFLSAKQLTNDALDMLEEMAAGDPQWRVSHEAWMRKSFDFLGDLHRGGPVASTMRIAIPFWQWYTHMLKLTFFTMPLKYPGRAAFIQMLGEIGADYQEEHGVLIPWAWSFVPFSTQEEALSGYEQLVTSGVDFENVVPQATIGRYTSRRGDANFGKFIQDSANPIMSNFSLIAWSIATQTAQEFDGTLVTKAAKDEFGVEITGLGDSQFWNYVANRVFRMVPLSPSLMSAMGRASTAFPFPGQMSEKYRPADAVAERAGEWDSRADVTDLGFNTDSWARFLMKIMVGVRWDEVEGLGPVWRKQMLDLMERLAREKSNDERRTAAAFKEAVYGASEIQ